MAEVMLPAPDDEAPTLPVARPAPSQPVNQVPDLPLPEELTALLPGGNYHVESFLGQGGMGAVYKGMQVRLKRPVAIKIMHRALGKDFDFAARFEREAQAMAKLNHPNIVSVIDYGEAGPDYLFIVMELVDGADMMDVIRTGRMTQEMALTLLPQICDALQFAHDHGIVHRDIKPSNIMLTRDGRVKMADFGLAKTFDAESSFRTQTGTGMGTPDYAAPEQFDPDGHIDHRADIYALGVMIYQMITGQLPRGVWKPPSQRAEVAPQWDDIVEHAMQSDPADRYQQASEVKTDVGRITPSVAVGQAPRLPGPAITPAGGAPALQSKSRAPLLFGVIGTVITLAVGAFFALPDAAPKSGGFQPPLNVATETHPPAAQGEATTLPNTDKSSPVKNAPAAAASPTIPAPKMWIDVTTAIRDSAGADSTEALPKGWRPTRLLPNIHVPQGDKAANLAIRIRHQGPFSFKFRHTTSTESTQWYGAAINGIGQAWIELGKLDKTTLENGEREPNLRLAESLPVKGFKTTSFHESIVTALGDELAIWLDGALMCKVNDARLTSGYIRFRAELETVIEKIEWGEIASTVVKSAPPEAASSPIATPALPESGWKPLFTSSDWKQTGSHGEFKDGLKHLKADQWTKPQTSPDGAIRARFQFRQDTRNPSVVTRLAVGHSFYKLELSNPPTFVYLQGMSGGKAETIAKHAIPKPPQPGETVELELRAQGDHLIGKLNGETVIDAHDARVTGAGEWGINANDGWYQSVEFLDLDKTTAVSPSPSLQVSSSSVAIATKDTPFVNTLGMKFVPVPITGGPTDGKRVLFSVWETRMQDYEVFAKETKRKWEKPDFEQGATHPAVNLNEEDAAAFCVWLTERERKAGQLGTDKSYRLPGDHEWSCAAGIGDREDAAKPPKEKSGRISTLYPWGAQWPPPPDAGNYSGEEFRDDPQSGKGGRIMLEGYNDGFAHSSPVGRFAVNPHGFYDLGGNAWEWCADSQEGCLVRGASCVDGKERVMLSSWRITPPPATRQPNYGFRCVLAPAAQ